MCIRDRIGIREISEARVVNKNLKGKETYTVRTLEFFSIITEKAPHSGRPY